MAENYSSIISSNAFDFENNNAQKTNIFTAENITRPIDQLPSSGGQPIEVIPPRGIDEIPEGGGQPIKVTPPPEVNQALYEITFNRKLYGANLDVVNTLEDIEFKQGFSGIKTPTLNIAYLTHWRRGNAPTAGEKISTENTDIKNTEFKTDKSTQTFEILENSTFKSSALIDYKGGQTGIGEGRITLNNSNIKSFLNEFPVWEVRAPDAIERNETIQPSDLRILDSVSINGFEEEEEFIFSDGYYSFDENSTVLFEQFKPETRPSKQDLISKAKQQLEIERAKDSPSAETIKYLEDKIKQLQSIDDSQFVQETNLPPDPRQEAPTEPAPIGGEVRKADVSWTTPSISTQNQTEKVEGIWQFLFNPQTLERSFGPEFKYASSWGVPDGQAAHYSGHKNEELRFRDIILNGFVFGKRVESLVKGLEELTYVERDSGQQSPPVLEFVWGKKVFGPCVMEDISVAEQKWDGGELVDATLSFTLKKIPEWVVNDEYINIFDPSGQPLQQIIVPDPASSTTGADTADAIDTGSSIDTDPEASTQVTKGTNAETKDCENLKDYFFSLKKQYDIICTAYIDVVSKEKNKTISTKVPAVHTALDEILKLVQKLQNRNSVYSQNKFLKKKYEDLVSYTSRGLIDSLKRAQNKGAVGISEVKVALSKILEQSNTLLEKVRNYYKNGSCGTINFSSCRREEEYGPANITSTKLQQNKACSAIRKRIGNIYELKPAIYLNTEEALRARVKSEDILNEFYERTMYFPGSLQKPMSTLLKYLNDSMNELGGPSGNKTTNENIKAWLDGKPLGRNFFTRDPVPIFIKYTEIDNNGNYTSQREVTRGCNPNAATRGRFAGTDGINLFFFFDGNNRGAGKEEKEDAFLICKKTADKILRSLYDAKCTR